MGGKVANAGKWCLVALASVLLMTNHSLYAADIEYQGLKIPDNAGYAMTVQGKLAPHKLGHTLSHEHLFIKYWLPLDEPERWQRILNVDVELPTSQEKLEMRNAPLTYENRLQLRFAIAQNIDSYTLDNVGDALAEVRRYQALGGHSIVDVTSMGLGRDPNKLREASLKSGAPIIMGTGYYRWAWHPEGLEKKSDTELTSMIVREVVEGFNGTDIKAGIIGEIPTVDMIVGPEGKEEERVLRASARASRLTGAPLSVTVPLKTENQIKYLHTILDIVEEEGGDLSRVTLGHMTVPSSELTFLISLLRRGVSLSYDTFGSPWPELVDNIAMMDVVHKLITHGYSRQVLVSHNYFSKHHQVKYGGFGLTYVHSVLLPYLKEQGVSEKAIQDIMENNAQKLLAFVAPRPL